MTHEHAPDLRFYLDRMAGRAVLVVGDLMLDQFVYGDVHRISPESPVPVLSKTRENKMVGGAGNVIANLNGLNVRTYATCVVGDDADGAQLRGLLAGCIENVEGVLIDPTRPTCTKTRFLSGTHQLLRVDFERTEPITAAFEAQIVEYAHATLPKVQAVVLSDYGKGVLTPNLLRVLIDAANKQGISVLIDPKGNDYTVYRGASVVTPNRKELSEATGGLPTREDSDVVDAAQTLITKTGIASVIATRSQDGMTIIRAHEKGFEAPVHLRTEALEVYDVSGAGDTVIATAAAALAAGAPLVQAAMLANIAGGIVVAKVGTTPVRANEIAAFLETRDRPVQTRAHGDRANIDTTRQSRVCDWDQAAEQVARWKARGLKIGFTNGCFDILHVGHVTYLNAARDACDRLIVGLNVDGSIRRLKGANRPVHDEQARAAVLGALGSVDMVVLFGAQQDEQDQPGKLIAALQPDVFFKGGDYTLETLPETKIVQAYGGQVRILPLVAGYSTTNAVNKISSAAE